MERTARLRAGDVVTVRPAAEIAATLDGEGAANGLPFMPEMLGLCGTSFVVERRVEKTCVDIAGADYANRMFPDGDVVVLDARCDGSAHDGCDRGCKIFWRESWLRRADADAGPGADDGGAASLLPRLKVREPDGRYVCQSTRLAAATVAPTTDTRVWRLRVIARELRNGDRTVAEMASLLGGYAWMRLQRLLRGEAWLRGSAGPTPTAALDLVEGERVRIKPTGEVVATLDGSRGNRGLRISPEMTRHFGHEAEVRGRVERLIDERTGRMIPIERTVSLRGVGRRDRKGRLHLRPESECLCAGETGDCPRGELMYWREIWLERLDEPRGRDGPGIGAARGG